MPERVRATDPATSHEAAARAETTLTPFQMRVLGVFRNLGDMNDKMLVRCVNDAEKSMGFQKLSSPSGIRSRRSELAKPNEDRMLELRRSFYIQHGLWPETSPGGVLDWERAAPKEHIAKACEAARNELRIEGFRSPLWNTGRTEKVDGHNVIVWGIAK